MQDTATLQKLILLFAPALEARLLEFLRTQSPTLPAFTLIDGEGHGEDFAAASLREQVLGRIEQRILWMILPADRCAALIEALADGFRGSGLVLWTEAVSSFRRLA